MQYDSRGSWSRVFVFSENGGGDGYIGFYRSGSSGKMGFFVYLGSTYTMVNDGDGGHTAYGQVPIDVNWIHVAATISGTAGNTK